MDINATLAEMRTLSKKILADEFPHDDDARRLAELVEAADEWLSKGRFLPKAWSR